jgi:uncharacterized iron-regulated membrane protein
MYDYYYGNAVGWGIGTVIISIVVWLGVALACAFISANMARKKGHSYGGFWALGFFTGIIGIIVAAVIEDKTKQAYQQPPYGQPPYPQPPYGQPPYQQPPYGQPPYQQPYQQPAAPAANCPSCGAAVPADSAFCQSCGTRVK